MKRELGIPLLLVLGLVGCRERTREAAEIVTELDRALLEVRAENLTLREENARLRAQTGAPTWDPVSQLERAGAAMGTQPYVRLCPVDRPAIGLRGRAGALIDQLVVVCAASPSSNGDFGLELDPVGTMSGGGTTYERLCPAEHVLIGLDGAAGDVIDALVPVCGPRDPAAAAAAAAAAAQEPEEGSAEGSGETPRERAARARRNRAEHRGVSELQRIGGHGGRDFERRCPTGSVMVGLSGRYGSVVESVVVHCAPLPGAG